MACLSMGSVGLDLFRFATTSGLNFALVLWFAYVGHLLMVNVGGWERLKQVKDWAWAGGAAAWGRDDDGETSRGMHPSGRD